MQGLGLRLVAGVLLLCGILLFGAFLIEIPSLHREQGLPLIPALIAAEGTLFAIALCAYGLHAFLLKPWLDRRGLARRRAAQSREPWLDNDEWAGRAVSHSAGGALVFLWVFTINWIAVLVFMAQDRGRELLDGPVSVLILCSVLVLIGLISVWKVIERTTHWLRFGRSTLVIDTLPGRPGKTFEGTIRARLKHKPKRPVSVSLSGFRRVWTERAYMRSDEERRVGDVRDEEPFFEKEERIAVARLARAGETTEVPVHFEIPTGAPSSGPQETDAEVIWKIHAHTTGKNDDRYTAEFEIPVFRE